MMRILPITVASLSAFVCIEGVSGFQFQSTFQTTSSTRRMNLLPPRSGTFSSSTGCRSKATLPSLVSSFRLLHLRATVNEQQQPQAVHRLLQLLDDGSESDVKIRQLVSDLTNSSGPIDNAIDDDSADVSSLFDPLLGYYNVTCSLPPPGSKSDRPVGGKWNQRNNPFLSIQSSYQHLIPPLPTQNGSVAQVINMIVVRALMWFQIYVILRGDAYPLSLEERIQIVKERATPGGQLSERTVRAAFDPPRIVICKSRAKNTAQNPHSLLSFSLGPSSSVVLDTPYCDNTVRIGKGSRGSLFVFTRLLSSSSSVSEADVWKDLWQVKPIKRLSFVTLFASIAAASWIATFQLFIGKLWWWNRLWSIPLGVTSLVASVMIALSTGGIQTNRKPTSPEQRT